MGGQPGPVRPDPEHRVPRAEHGRVGLQPPTGTLAYVYTNYIHGGGERQHRCESLARRRHDVVGRQTISLKARAAGAQQPVLPLDRRRPRAGGSYAMWLDRRQDPANHDIGTFQARSFNDGATWPNKRHQHRDVGPRPRVLQQRARSSATTAGSPRTIRRSTRPGPTGATATSSTPASARRTSSPPCRSSAHSLDSGKGRRGAAHRAAPPTPQVCAEHQRSI